MINNLCNHYPSRWSVLIVTEVPSTTVTSIVVALSWILGVVARLGGGAEGTWLAALGESRFVARETLLGLSS